MKLQSHCAKINFEIYTKPNQFHMKKSIQIAKFCDRNATPNRMQDLRNQKMNVSCHSSLYSKNKFKISCISARKKLDNSRNSNKLSSVYSDVMSFKLIPPFLFMCLVILTNYAREGLSFLNLLINYLTQPH